jgi:uroporphyrinogen-III synthase
MPSRSRLRSSRQYHGVARMSGVLAGRRVVVPETRELDVLAQMLERQGATAIRCPLVSIHDTPDEAHVVAWLRRFVETPPDDLILMTGEGLQRLVGFARRVGLEDAFRALLGKVRKITRGPKPVRRLRELGLEADLAADPPTSEGIVAVLQNDNLSGRRVAVQLYPELQTSALLDFLDQHGAKVDPVLCYVYGSQTEDARVVEIIDEMAEGRVDLITFTSSPQVRRLEEVAGKNRREARLREALRRTTVAAVGPVVGRAVEQAGARVSIMPENFHLRPMVNAILEALDIEG